MDNFDLKKYLAEGRLYEESIPSGWKKIDTSNDYEEEAEQGRLMGFEAPMNGIEGDEVDNIYIEQDEDEFEVHVITAFNNPEYKGPFNSKEEALKVAIQKMEDLKKDWDKDLAEGKLVKENMQDEDLLAKLAIDILDEFRVYAESEDLIQYLNKSMDYLERIPSNDDVYSAIQAVADGLNPYTGEEFDYEVDEMQSELERLIA